MPKTCAFPGCGETLYSRNRSGVCRAHNHAVGVCRCFTCSGQAMPASIPVTVVQVPYATSNSGVPGTKPVTLPKAPWSDQ